MLTTSVTLLRSRRQTLTATRFALSAVARKLPTGKRLLPGRCTAATVLDSKDGANDSGDVFGSKDDAATCSASSVLTKVFSEEVDSCRDACRVLFTKRAVVTTIKKMPISHTEYPTAKTT
eukprot:6174902-Pleurochrysis_carterae.AAC.2